MEQGIVSTDAFKKRMVDLCLKSGLTEFPTKHRDQLFLLKSIAISFNERKIYSEVEVNVGIKQWLDRMNSYFPSWDHVTLRRRLIDEQFFIRNQDGSSYRINPGGPAEIVFDPGINELDVHEVLTEGRELISRKKAEYLKNLECRIEN